MNTSVNIANPSSWTEVEGDLLLVLAAGTILRIIPDHHNYGMVFEADLQLLSDHGIKLLKRISLLNKDKPADVCVADRVLAHRLMHYAAALYPQRAAGTTLGHGGFHANAKPQSVWAEVEGDWLMELANGTILKIVPDRFDYNYLFIADLELLSERGWEHLKRITYSKPADMAEADGIAAMILAKRLMAYATVIFPGSAGESKVQVVNL